VRVEQRVWNRDGGWRGAGRASDVALVLVFGGTEALAGLDWVDALRRDVPNARFFGSSTAGEIVGTRVLDDSIVATCIAFDDTRVEVACVELHDHERSSDAGARLASRLPPEGLRHVLVLSDGLHVDGTGLTAGLRSVLPHDVAVTGGLSADGPRFERTLVVADGPPRSGIVAAVGLYGSSLRVGYGSLGGWDSFGPERLITRSEGNVLHELDGKNALDLYKTYLGEHARELPASALRFPLMLRGATGEQGLVRTILGIDEDAKSMRFAGEMPEGSYARLMRANFERLIDGAHGAAGTALQTLGGGEADLAILISCVGRRLVLQQRVEEEIESVREVLGMRPVLAGFYSYGEICPAAPAAGCELHNQTMTITTLGEVA
jgi:hypothetical protein